MSVRETGNRITRRGHCRRSCREGLCALRAWFFPASVAGSCCGASLAKVRPAAAWIPAMPQSMVARLASARQRENHRERTRAHSSATRLSLPSDPFGAQLPGLFREAAVLFAQCAATTPTRQSEGHGVCADSRRHVPSVKASASATGNRTIILPPSFTRPAISPASSPVP